ncbi:MAG TPA: 4a-hydroxytetrahydrobiopterin dehydratase [Thermoplasmata archaeon]
MARERLSEAEIAKRLAEVPEWKRAGDAIRRTWTFDAYPDAVAFIVRVAFLAEAANHHPDLTNSWTSVTLSLTTHDAGGLTDRDFKLAKRIDAL